MDGFNLENHAKNYLSAHSLNISLKDLGIFLREGNQY